MPIIFGTCSQIGIVKSIVKAFLLFYSKQNVGSLAQLGREIIGNASTDPGQLEILNLTSTTIHVGLFFKFPNLCYLGHINITIVTSACSN